MKTIKQYVVKPDQNMVLIPGSSILSVSGVDGEIVVNVLVDTEDMEGRPFEFKIFETGKEVDIEPAAYTFLGTVSFSESACHVFYKDLSSADL